MKKNKNKNYKITNKQILFIVDFFNVKLISSHYKPYITRGIRNLEIN
jgi:hypothetical protein